MRDLRLESFDSIWFNRDGKTIKKIGERSVIRKEVLVGGKKKYFYFKLHNLEYVGIRRFLTIFFSKFPVSQGFKEFKNMCDFREHDLATVIPVAAGEKFHRFFWVKSFLITEDFSPYNSLEDLLRNRPEFLEGPENGTRKKILLNEIAVFARKMHQNGFNHLDFNATHILLHYRNDSETPEIAIFDLQRVNRRKFFRYRWMIKSLARLNYTLTDNIFDKEDRISLLLFYKGKSKLNLRDALQLTWIRRKTARIKKHTEKMKR